MDGKLLTIEQETKDSPERWLILSTLTRDEYSPARKTVITSTRGLAKDSDLYIAPARSSRVLCTGHGSDSLDVFRVEGKSVRLETTLTMPVKIGCFTTDGESLLLISRLGSHFVIIFRVRDWDVTNTPPNTSVYFVLVY